MPGVAGVAEPVVSPDGRVAVLEVGYGVPADELTDADRAALRAAAEGPGLRVELSGDACRRRRRAPGSWRGSRFAAVVLTVTLGSLTAAGLPLLTAIAGIGVGLSAIVAASGFLTLNSDTPALALMLGLAVAIDYALFIISRYRDEVLAGREPVEAAGRAVGTAGTAVVFAGLTVVIALAGLAVVGIPVLTELGLAAALTVAVSVLVALTLLPALIGFVAGRWGRRPARARTGGRWGRFVTARPVPVLAFAVAALAVAAVPALDLRLGLPGDGTAPRDTTQRRAYDLVADAFGPGFNGPLTLVVQDADAAAAARRVTATVGALDGVADVRTAAVDDAGRTALVRVVPDGGPTSEATEELIEEIRDATGPGVAVTGRTAIDVDTSRKLAGALTGYLLLIVGLAFLLLMLVFRSVLVPLKATAGFLLSIAATFGAVVAVFQWGWLDGVGVHASGIIVNLLPVMMIGMVFGLAMDYQVFLVTRMREEHVRGAAPVPSVVAGLAHGSRVVTAAALIMISVFAGFVLSDLPMLQSFGFALAVAVFFDAFVVRMTIVPAVLALLGRAGWWLPRWLDRVLPRVDVEGRGLVDGPDGR
ncbi:MMPL family transporter [Actinomadura sp. CNU-125]|uniref:MMPL family transporter n=1 Tax=Actinomadura sp. CNU-125 TaxID=1904961 RepID=UPI000AFAD2C6|nr:MMPL family transporter [Actinomadura sp. CNU-125]